MDMNGSLLEQSWIQVELFAIGLQESKRCNRGFLHYVSEVSCELQFALAFAEAGLDEQDIATNISPGKAYRHTGHIGYLIHIVAVSWLAQNLFYITGGQHGLDLRLHRIFPRFKAHDTGQQSDPVRALRFPWYNPARSSAAHYRPA